MASELFTLTVADGTGIATRKWLPAGEAKAVVLIAHGMAEHAARYESFAGLLNDHGYAVYAPDHRGHGETAKLGEMLGHFADSNGWATVVEDLAALVAHIRAEHPGVKVFYFGHSMGSMLGRSFAIAHGKEIDGLVLSGTAGDPGALGAVGMTIAKVEARLRGKRFVSKLMNALTFGQYNAAFKPARTEFDWLSRDNPEVDKYVADPWCGNIHTSGFFVDILTGLNQINSASEVARIPADLPVYCYAGAMDPVAGKNAAGARGVAQQMRAAGVREVSEKYYDDARHEVHNETNRDEVLADVIAWFDAHL